MILLPFLAALFTVLLIACAGQLVVRPALARRRHYRCLTNIAALERELGMNLPEHRAAFIASANYTQLQKPYLLGYPAASAYGMNVIDIKRSIEYGQVSAHENTLARLSDTTG